MGIALVTTADFTVVRFVTGVYVRVLLPIGAVSEPSIASFVFTFEGFFTCMSPFMYFQVFTSGKYFPTSGKRTGEGFFSRVNPDVIDQFVLGLKRPSVATTVLPIASVIGTFGSSDMFHADVRYDFVHGGESFVAGLPGCHLVLFHPEAGQLLLNWRPHVTEESPRASSVRGRCRHLVEGLWSAVHICRWYGQPDLVAGRMVMV